MFRRIVVPLDGSRFAEAALAPARELARAFGAIILLVRAVPVDGAAMAVVARDPQVTRERVDDADAYLHGVVDDLRTAGYDADMALYIAEPGTGIARVAELDAADVIVMATHLRWKVDVHGPASTTMAVLARSRVPILVWRVAVEEPLGGPDIAERAPIFSRMESPIVVPLDGTPFAERALPFAETLARAFGLYLLLVRAIEPEIAGDGAATREREREAAAYLASVRAAIAERGGRATALVHKGTPLSVIDTAWREYDGSLIVLASHGPDEQPRGMLGSVAARLVEEVEAPVLVLQPEPITVFRNGGATLQQGAH